MPREMDLISELVERKIRHIQDAVAVQIRVAVVQERHQWEAALEGSAGVDPEIVRLVQHARGQWEGAAMRIERNSCARFIEILAERGRPMSGEEGYQTAVWLAEQLRASSPTPRSEENDAEALRAVFVSLRESPLPAARLDSRREAPESR